MGGCRTTAARAAGKAGGLRLRLFFRRIQYASNRPRLAPQHARSRQRAVSVREPPTTERSRRPNVRLPTVFLAVRCVGSQAHRPLRRRSAPPAEAAARASRPFRIRSCRRSVHRAAECVDRASGRARSPRAGGSHRRDCVRADRRAARAARQRVRLQPSKLTIQLKSRADNGRRWSAHYSGRIMRT